MARFLIIDDEPLIALLAQDWLEDLGHETVGPAYDLQTALNLTNEPLDAAILDLRLGADKSFPVAKQLQARAIPFAFATGQAADGMEREFPDALTLPKPFSFEMFSSVVSQLVRAGGVRSP